MSNTFEPLNKPDSTIQDAGLYQGQVQCNFYIHICLFFLMKMELYSMNLPPF